MALLEQIQSDLIAAMKEKDEKKLKALRMLSSAIKNEEISRRPEQLKEEDILQVLKREVKKLRDAISDFSSGGRDDLASEYKEEMKVLEKYLPEQMSEEDVRKIVQDKLTEGDFGKIMKAVMSETKGQADGGLVSKIVKEELEKG